MQHDIWKFCVIIVIAGLVGFVLEQPLLVMLLAAIGIIAWQIFQLQSLYRWIINPQKNAMEDTDGQIYLLHREVHRRNTTNRRHKRQLSGFLAQFRKAISALPDAIVLIDDNGKIEWANPNAEKVLGIKWPDDAKVGFTDLIRHSELDTLLSFDTPPEQGVEINFKSNRKQTINVKCVRYTDTLRMVIARDVSRLIKVNQMHADFVANVSHELKTPLTVLRGYLEIIQESDDIPDTLVKPFQQMNVQGTRMQLIVSDLLYLAKLEDTENIRKKETVDITQVIHTILESVQALIENKGHTIELNIDSKLMLMGAQTELHSAFNNLISNAIHYTPAQGLIQISWQKNEYGASFSVEDNGFGIPKHHLGRLTQRFYRVDTDRSREGGGTGLGLAIVKHVLQRHDASLEISSTEGSGSKFYCFFPTQSNGSNGNAQTLIKPEKIDKKN